MNSNSMLMRSYDNHLETDHLLIARSEMRLKRSHLAVAVSLLLVAGSILWLTDDGLEGIEHECKDELLKSDDIVGITDFKIVKHYNWWENTYQGSWVVGGPISKPYRDPRADMKIQFKREDGLPHEAWVLCQFSIVPNSGDPPQVRFESVRLLWENVADPYWTPWHPNQPGSP